ncbi:MAG: hypothetical protein HYZ93_05215 [Candidatus Omnitrophica bacterium]|nr:hypothetical protein [Candidatus Omnitrophota bacterium]
MIRRRRLLLLGILLAVASSIAFGFQWFLNAWLPGTLKRQLPLPVVLGPVRWSPPFGVRIDDLEIPQPGRSDHPYLLKAKQLHLQVPWWGLFVRPLPVEVRLVSPRLIPTSQTAELLAPLFFNQAAEAGWIRFPQRAANPPVFLIGLRLVDGRVDFPEVQTDPSAPPLILGHLELEGKLSSVFSHPTITLKARGDFLSPSAEKIGSTSVESVTDPVAGNMQGRLEIWHGRLSDFRTIYQYAPAPFFFEGGQGGPIIEWRIRDKDEVSASMRCLAQGLRIAGKVGGVPWNTILQALEDPSGRIDLTVTAEGSLSDPAFDVHNRLLSGLDWAMKERAAAKGIDIPGRIFFGLDEPPEEEEPESPAARVHPKFVGCHSRESGNPDPRLREDDSPKGTDESGMRPAAPRQRRRLDDDRTV